jgi:hypothetical protein
MCKVLKVSRSSYYKFRPYTLTKKEKILNKDFSTTTINEKWVTDITYYQR